MLAAVGKGNRIVTLDIQARRGNAAAGAAA